MRNKWTIEKAKEVAKECKTRSELQTKYVQAYYILRTNKLLDDACSHMLKQSHNIKKWTKEKCIEIAKNYTTIKDISRDYSGMYQLIRRRGWFDEVCSHLKYSGSYVKRMIYAYEFEDKSVYVGLTCDLKRRHQEHLTSDNDIIHKKITESKLKYNLVEKTDYIDYLEASKKEGEFLNEYIENGWISLNVSKTGGLGGTITVKQKKLPIKRIVNGEVLSFWNEQYWTYDRCKNEAIKYKTKKEFSEKCSGAYYGALKLGIIDDICSHMESLHEVWTKEMAIEEIKKYKTKKDFKKYSPKCYRKCSRMGWLKELTKGLIDMNEVNTVHTYENTKEVVSQYRTFEEMKKSNDIFTRGALNWINRKKLKEEFRQHLKN